MKMACPVKLGTCIYMNNTEVFLVYWLLKPCAYLIQFSLLRMHVLCTCIMYNTRVVLV